MIIAVLRNVRLELCVETRASYVAKNCWQRRELETRESKRAGDGTGVPVGVPFEGGLEEQTANCCMLLAKFSECDQFYIIWLVICLHQPQQFCQSLRETEQCSTIAQIRKNTGISFVCGVCWCPLVGSLQQCRQWNAVGNCKGSPKLPFGEKVEKRLEGRLAYLPVDFRLVLTIGSFW